MRSLLLCRGAALFFAAATAATALGEAVTECRPKVLPVFQYAPAAETWEATNAPSAVRRTVARDEWVNISFAFLPVKDAADVRARPLVLRKGEEVWETGADLRIVHTLPRIDYTSVGSMFSMVEPYEQYYRPAPELLLKDDTMKIEEHWEGNRYFPPSFPKEFHTRFAKGEVKWLWLSLRVPKDLGAGLYDGQLEILADAHVAVTLPISLDVLDVELPDAGKIYGFYLRASRNPADDCYVDEVRYQAQLHAMRELGINALKLDAFVPGQLDKLDEVLGWMREEGFSMVVLQTCGDAEHMKKSAALLAKHGYPPLFYGYDEPDAKNPKVDTIYRDVAKTAQEGGGKIVSAMTTPSAIVYAKAGLLDAPIVNQFYIPATKVSVPYMGPEEWISELAGVTFVHRLYYWQSWFQWEEQTHRRQWGFYLYRSGFDGVMPYCLMAFQKGLPYHTDMRFYDYLGKRRPMKMFCTAYPAKDGIVPTLQWEAAREGITDMRWIRLYEKLDQASNGALGRVRLEQALQPFYYRGGGGNAEMDDKFNPEPEPKVFEKARQLLIDAVAGYVKDKVAPPFTLATHTDVGDLEQEWKSCIGLGFFDKPAILGGKTCRSTKRIPITQDGRTGLGKAYIYLRLDDLSARYQVKLSVWGRSRFVGLRMQDQATGQWRNIAPASLSGDAQWDTYTATLPTWGYDSKCPLQTVSLGEADGQIWISHIEVAKLDPVR